MYSQCVLKFDETGFLEDEVVYMQVVEEVHADILKRYPLHLDIPLSYVSGLNHEETVGVFQV